MHIASASVDKTVKVWNTKTYSLVQTLKSHNKWVNYCSWSPDGMHIASASVDKTVKVWNTKTYSLVQTLKSHNKWVNYCSWSPDGMHIASASGDNTVKLWDATEFKGPIQDVSRSSSRMTRDEQFDSKLNLVEFNKSMQQCSLSMEQRKNLEYEFEKLQQIVLDKPKSEMSEVINKTLCYMSKSMMSSAKILSALESKSEGESKVVFEAIAEKIVDELGGDTGATTNMTGLELIGSGLSSGLVSELLSHRSKFKELSKELLTEQTNIAMKKYLSVMESEGKEGVCTENEMLSARLYTLEDIPIYKEVNKLLRSSFNIEETKSKQKVKQGRKDIEKLMGWRIFINHLNLAVERLPQHSGGTLYRGQKYIPHDIKLWKVGSEIIWPAFSSCSVDRMVAWGFAERKLLFVIERSELIGGASLDEYAWYQGEKEVLLPALCKFVIKDIEKDGKDVKYIVRLEPKEKRRKKQEEEMEIMVVDGSQEKEATIEQVPILGNTERQNPPTSIMKKLFKEAKNGKVKMFDTFELSSLPSIDVENEEGHTLLYHAAKYGHATIVALLLMKGANVNKINGNGSTALHVAACYGHGVVLKILLEAGGSMDIKNKHGVTAEEEGTNRERSGKALRVLKNGQADIANKAI
eukprot:TRINITY_DN1349_c1_g1_i2.p1 TRINITY_DN1349_c1_g1~~TRINITY_DN1349_c1_g1_i2.p1  ORF type:complete len:636 (+),score=94.12 TRINITY_DN1349_c1_g1_i2:2-1909(+)